MKKQMKMLALLSALALNPALSQAVDKAKVDTTPQLSLAKLQGAYKQAASVSADFTQEVYQASLARTKTSKGNLKLSKPGMVRWEISEPEATVMVSDGRKVSYFTPDARGKGKG
ncbi:MAG: outer membrane lipoprotein carrier protein LolA, partial [Proteobacteria bacterium]